MSGKGRISGLLEDVSCSLSIKAVILSSGFDLSFVEDYVNIAFNLLICIEPEVEHDILNASEDNAVIFFSVLTSSDIANNLVFFLSDSFNIFACAVVDIWVSDIEVDFVDV